MNIVIPMAGMGKRMRPHTLTIPKPLIPLAGKPIVQRLCEDIVKVTGEKVEEIAFIVGHFGKENEERLLNIAKTLGAEGKIYYQEEPLGTAHAIHCAKEALHGKVTVAFADTLFDAHFVLDTAQEGIIWTHCVEDPSVFGVVRKDEKGVITGFVEKPQTFVSNEAIIGIYYFKDGDCLRRELQYLLDNHVVKSGEYQLTDALENMMKKGTHFVTGSVAEWLDCGNKNATVYTHQRVLELKKDKEKLVSDTLQTKNSVIIPPCYIGKDVQIENSIIGPHVSLGDGCRVNRSIITDSVVQNKTILSDAHISHSMIGSEVKYKGKPQEVSLGDYNEVE